MADYKLSELTAKTIPVGTDILHVRTVGGIDQKITWVNLLKAVNPVGTIKMFDANNPGGGGAPTGVSGGWTDDDTIPGWYACIAGNSDHGCPNLVDKFIMGKVIAGAAGTGGANAITITSAMLPIHTHAIDHEHPNKTSTGPSTANTSVPSTANTSVQSVSHAHSMQAHTHTTDIGSHGHDVEKQDAGDNTDIILRETLGEVVNTTSCTLSNSAVWTTAYWRDLLYHIEIRAASVTIGNKTSGGPSSANTGNQSVSHTHTMQAHTHTMQAHTHDVNIVAFIGASGNGGFANDAFNNRPAYYSVIFIRKCA